MKVKKRKKTIQIEIQISFVKIERSIKRNSILNKLETLLIILFISSNGDFHHIRFFLKQS